MLVNNLAKIKDWECLWSRGALIQKAIDYSIAAGEPFARFWGKGILNWLCVSHNRNVEFCLSRREYDDLQKYWKKSFSKNKKFLNIFLSDIEKLYNPHLTWLNKNITKADLTKLSNEKLAKIYKEYHEHSVIKFFFILWMPALIEENILVDIVENILPGGSEIVFSISKKNYLTLEEEDLYKISLLPKSKQNAALLKHVKKHEYIPMYDYNYSPYDLAYFQKRLDEMKADNSRTRNKLKEIKENGKRFDRLLKNKKLSAFEKIQLKAIHAFYNHKDQRSRYRSLDSYLGRKFYDEIVKRLGVSLDDLMFYTHEEVIDGLLHGKKVVDLIKRKSAYALYVAPGIVEVDVGKKAQKIIDEVGKCLKSKKEVSEIKGVAVCGGIVKGKVRIVLKTDNLINVKAGDILVAPMTRPDYVSAMKKVAGIVTDEGGLLCHAAIVSRELKKPCIVGTKNATKILKDGDIIEVDANKGIIKILK